MQVKAKASIFIILILFLLFLPKVHATTNIAWNPNIDFYLPTHGYYIGFSDTVYFDSAIWDDPVATNIEWINIYMGSGETIPSFIIDNQDANVTITSLSEITWLNYTVTSNGTQHLRVLPTPPTSVYLDGVNSTTGWAWGPAGYLTVFNATSTAAIYFGGLPGMTLDTAFAIGALALIIALSAFGAIFLIRRRND